MAKGIMTRCGNTMTESAYLAWIRSALRSKSLKWPPRAEALKLARRAYKGANKLQKWEFLCAICGGWFKMKDCVVDHHPVAAGSILSVEDIGTFASNLYCEVDNLRVLCYEDHAIWTYAEKMGVSFEEARTAKQTSSFMKQDKDIVIQFLKENGIAAEDYSNTSKRKKSVEKLFREGVIPECLINTNKLE